MKKDDVIELRNYFSTQQQASLTPVGPGTVPIICAYGVVTKLASYPCEHEMKNRCEYKKFKCEYEKIKHKYCFEHILNKLLQEKIFDIDMCDVHGDFFGSLPQQIAVESPLMFDNSSEINLIDFTAGTSDMTVKKSGIYIAEYLINTVQPSQFTIFVNGVPKDATNVVINKGSAQMLSRSLLNLNAGDVVNIKNHTTTTGAVELSVNAGGFEAATNHKFLLYKIGSMPPCVPKPEGCECDDHNIKFEKLYDMFIHYIDNDPRFSIHGISAYCSVFNQCDQVVHPDQAITFALNGNLIKRVYHQQGSDEVHIHKDGIYKIMYSDTSDQPIQVSVTVNGNILPGGIGGTNDGACQISVRQLLALHDGDIIKVINHTSTSGQINLYENAGGHLVGMNTEFSCYRIDNLPMPIPQHPPHPPKSKKIN